MKSDCILSVSAVHCSLNNLINIKIDWSLTINSSSLVLRVSLGQRYSNYVWGPFGGLWVVTVFIVILRRYLPFPLSFSHLECRVIDKCENIITLMVLECVIVYSFFLFLWDIIYSTIKLTFLKHAVQGLPWQSGG